MSDRAHAADLLVSVGPPVTEVWTLAPQPRCGIMMGILLYNPGEGEGVSQRVWTSKYPPALLPPQDLAAPAPQRLQRPSSSSPPLLLAPFFNLFSVCFGSSTTPIC